MTRGANSECAMGDRTLVYEAYKPQRERRIVRHGRPALGRAQRRTEARGLVGNADYAPGDICEFRLTGLEERDRDENRRPHPATSADKSKKERP